MRLRRVHHETVRPQSLNSGIFYQSADVAANRLQYDDKLIALCSTLLDCVSHHIICPEMNGAEKGKYVRLESSFELICLLRECLLDDQMRMWLTQRHTRYSATVASGIAAFTRSPAAGRRYDSTGLLVLNAPTHPVRARVRLERPGTPSTYGSAGRDNLSRPLQPIAKERGTANNWASS